MKMFDPTFSHTTVEPLAAPAVSAQAAPAPEDTAPC